MKDFYFSDDGDFILDENSDLLDTSYDVNRDLIQGIRSRLNFNKNEWPGSSKNIGANLKDFIGLSNTKETGDAIRSRILSELTKDGFLKFSDVKIDVVPVSKTSVVCQILVKAQGKILKYIHYFTFEEKSPYRLGERNAV